MMSQPDQPAYKRKRSRSPNYPGIDLGDAIDRANRLYDMEGQNVTPLNAALGHWGYKPQSGGGLVVVAALKQFGLIEDEGSGEHRMIRLSALALRIIRDDRPNSPERREAIQKAALAPRIHNDLWTEFQGSLPSDENLKYKLKISRGFSDLGATEFVRQFRSTVAFTQLDQSAIVSGSGEDRAVEGTGGSGTSGEESREEEAVSAGRRQRTVQLPISGTEWATLQAPFPISEGAWQQMMAVLNAMKPALTEASEEDV